MRLLHEQGFTLVETLLGVALLIGGASAFLIGLNGTMVHSEYLSQYQVALNAAQGQLEALAATRLDLLSTGGNFGPARANGQGVGIGEDLNCNGVLDGGEDVNGNGRLDSPLPGGCLAIQIKNIDGSVPAADSTVLDLHVAACWRFRGRTIGEDQNCNGQLDPGSGEDLNGNGWLDSPVMVSTRVAKRD